MVCWRSQILTPTKRFLERAPSSSIIARGSEEMSEGTLYDTVKHWKTKEAYTRVTFRAMEL